MDGSSSVCTKKIHLCIEYRELNERIKKDVYTLLLVVEVQYCLANCCYFFQDYISKVVTGSCQHTQMTITRWFLSWVRNGTVPLQADYVWPNWSSGIIPATHGQNHVWTSLCILIYR